MNTSAVKAQALLSSDELAYLLALVSAGAVVGLDNNGIAAANLEEGFSRLVSNGWLTENDGTHTLNNRLAMLVAVMTAPDRSLMVTRKNGDTEQVVTYGIKDGSIVEHYGTQGDRHLITELSDETEVLRRVCQAMGGVVSAENPVGGVRLSATLFGRAVAKPTAAGRRESLLALFRAGGAEEIAALHWSTAITPSEWSVSIEGAGYAGRQPASRRDIYCFGSPGVLVAGGGGTEDEIAVCGYTEETLASLLDVLWRSLADHRQTVVEG